MRAINRIILHHSLTKDGATVSWDAIRRYHVEQLCWSDIGYHFGIELVGAHLEVFRGRSLHKIGAHVRGHNDDSIGICVVGNYDVEIPTQAQYELAAGLCQDLMMVFALPVDAIHAHHEYTAYKTCPGRLFDMNVLRQTILEMSDV